MSVTFIAVDSNNQPDGFGGQNTNCRFPPIAMLIRAGLVRKEPSHLLVWIGPHA